MQDSMFGVVLRSAYGAVNFNGYACEQHNDERAAFNAGEFAGYADLLRLMGHEVAYRKLKDDNGCIRISALKMDGDELLVDGEWQPVFAEKYDHLLW